MRIVSILLLALAWMAPCYARGDSPTATIDVRATGEVIVPADVVVLPLSLTIKRADVQAAKDDNDRIATRVYELAESQGIPRPHLLMTNLRFEFDDEPLGKGGNGRNKGGNGGKKRYRVDEADSAERAFYMSRDLYLTFDSLAQAVRFVGEIVKWDEVCKTYELRLMPLRFDVADGKPSSLEARRRAMDKARERAAVLAEQAGLILGDAIQVYDDGTEQRVGRGTLFPDDDPFGDPFVDARRPTMRQHLSLDFRLVGAGGAPAADKVDLDRIPPARLTIGATVRVVYETRKP